MKYFLIINGCHRKAIRSAATRQTTSHQPEPLRACVNTAFYSECLFSPQLFPMRRGLLKKRHCTQRLDSERSTLSVKPELYQTEILTETFEQIGWTLNVAGECCKLVVLVNPQLTLS